MACLTYRRRGASVTAIAPTDNPALSLAPDGDAPAFDEDRPARSSSAK